MSASGYKLGVTLDNVRQGRMLDGKPDEAERRALLASKGVKMSIKKEMHDAAWVKFVAELDIFILEKGHTDVPCQHKSASGYNLGVALCNVRRGRMLDGKPDEAERRALLASKDVKMNVQKEMFDAAYTEFKEKMRAYVVDNKTSRVPSSFKTSDGYPLR